MYEENEPTILNEDGTQFHNEPSSEDKLFAMLLYVLNFFTAIIGPLIIWLIKRETSPFIDYHGKEYFNLIISYFVYEIVAAITMIIGIGFILVPVLSIAFVVLIVVGAVKAYQGEHYRFPLIFRLIK